jgi:hypothetical protein
MKFYPITLKYVTILWISLLSDGDLYRGRWTGKFKTSKKSMKSQALIWLGGLILYIIERSRTLFTLYFYLLNKNFK